MRWCKSTSRLCSPHAIKSPKRWPDTNARCCRFSAIPERGSCRQKAAAAPVYMCRPMRRRTRLNACSTLIPREKGIQHDHETHGDRNRHGHGYPRRGLHQGGGARVARCAVAQLAQRRRRRGQTGRLDGGGSADRRAEARSRRHRRGVEGSAARHRHGTGLRRRAGIFNDAGTGSTVLAHAAAIVRLDV